MTTSGIVASLLLLTVAVVFNTAAIRSLKRAIDHQRKTLGMLVLILVEIDTEADSELDSSENDES